MRRYRAEDGVGLSSGFLMDSFLTEYLKETLPKHVKCHEGEADCKIGDFTPMKI